MLICHMSSSNMKKIIPMTLLIRLFSLQVTASFALSIISILGTIFGTVVFIRSIISLNHYYYYFSDDHFTYGDKKQFVRTFEMHNIPYDVKVCVFKCYSSNNNNNHLSKTQGCLCMCNILNLFNCVVFCSPGNVQQPGGDIPLPQLGGRSYTNNHVRIHPFGTTLQQHTGNISSLMFNLILRYIQLNV